MPQTDETPADLAPASPEAPASGGHGLRYIPELSGLRGLAILCVFGHHAFTTTVRETLSGGWPPYIESLSRGFEPINFGPDISFALSGFLITSILLRERKSPRFYQDFYWKRALRILPLYLTALLLLFIAFRQTGYTLMSVGFAANFAGMAHVRVTNIGPFWTLAIEEQFYLLWPSVVRRLTVTHIRNVAIGIGLCSMTLRFLLALRNHHDYGLTPLRCDGLAFGAALACHYFVAGSNLKLRAKVNPLLWALLSLGVTLLIINVTFNLGRLENPTLQAGVVLVTGSFTGLCISFSGAKLLAFFRTRVLIFFALISYSLCLVHIYAILTWKHFHGRLKPGDVRGFAIQIAASLALSVIAALITRHVIELPAMRLRRFVLKHPNRNAERASPPLPLAQM